MHSCFELVGSRQHGVAQQKVDLFTDPAYTCSIFVCGPFLIVLQYIYVLFLFFHKSQKSLVIPYFVFGF